jgi:hypothetical protein
MAKIITAPQTFTILYSQAAGLFNHFMEMRGSLWVHLDRNGFHETAKTVGIA